MTGHSDADSLVERPRVALIVEEHWLFIQRQYRLSPRELQVAKLVCQGFNNEEIATNLKMKLGTVKTHIRNIYRRIRVSSKIEMLLKFVDGITKLSTKKAISLPVPIVVIAKARENINPSDISPKK
jgi:DNA-binding CsgD family transcriptional regulator